MGAFTDLLGKFDKAVEDVNAKKAALDKANAATTIASNDYNASVDAAAALRDQINESLGKVLPALEPGRVRVSG